MRGFGKALIMVSAASVMGAGLASSAVAQSTSTGSYRINANDDRTVDIRACGREVRIVADGDNDTDLDFVLRDASGTVVHEDSDLTDLMIARLTQSTACASYKLHVTNLGRVYNMMSLRIETTQPWSQSNDGRDRRVSIHNHTNEDFMTIRFSNTASTVWGPDRLGSGILRAHTNRTFDMDDRTGACRFDVQVTTRSGQTYTRTNVDACSISTLEFGTEINH